MIDATDRHGSSLPHGGLEDLDLQLLPTPLAMAIHHCMAEPDDQPFRRVHRLIDLIEVLVKLHTVIAVSDYFRRAAVSDDVRGLLAAGLRRPSLGVWWHFCRECLKESAAADSAETEAVPGLHAFAVGRKNSRGLLFKRLEKDGPGVRRNLLWLRNHYAHGATPPDDRCAADYAEYAPLLAELVDTAAHLKELPLRTHQSGQTLVAVGLELRGMAVDDAGDDASSHQDGECWLQLGNGVLSLHPLLTLREVPDGESRFFFYNDLAKKAVRLLNYECALHARDQQLYGDLIATYHLDQWQRLLTETFRARIEELTESFKGRLEELKALGVFACRRRPGIMRIWGGPGIGKSALMARFLEMLRWSPEARRDYQFPDDESAPDSFIVVEYFIRRSEGNGDLASLQLRLMETLREHAALKARCEFAAYVGDTSDMRARQFKDDLRRVSKALKENERLVLLIDGLDEAEPEVLPALPSELPERVVALYASRETDSVKSIIGNNEMMAREQVEDLSVGPMRPEDIRALLSDYVSKYEVEIPYLSRVADRSKGNPLYLKLLCHGLEVGDYQLNTIVQLPRQLGDIYATAMRRLNTEHSRAGDWLRLLAAAQDWVPAELAGRLLGLDADDRERLLAITGELTTENRLTEAVDDYQLFHESLREYLAGHFVAEVAASNRRLAFAEFRDTELPNSEDHCDWLPLLADWPGRWEHLNHGRAARAYVLRHGIDHMLRWREHLDPAQRPALDAAVCERLDDERFRTAVFEECGNAISLQRDLLLAQSLQIERYLDFPAERQAGDLGAIIKRAADFHKEPSERYEKQLQHLRAQGRAGKTDGLYRVAAMGNDANSRLLLLIEALWLAPAASTILPADLKREVEAWLQQADNSTLTDLWNATCARLSSLRINSPSSERVV